MSLAHQGNSRQQRGHLSHIHSQTNASETYNSFYDSNKDPDEVSYDMAEIKNKAKKQESNVYFDFTEVFVWGDDSYGQLGLYHQKLKKGNKEQISFKLPKTCSFNILIKQVACGENHSSILTS